MSGRLGVAIASATASNITPARASPVAPIATFHAQPHMVERATGAAGTDLVSFDEGGGGDEGSERAMGPGKAAALGSG